MQADLALTRHCTNTMIARSVAFCNAPSNHDHSRTSQCRGLGGTGGNPISLRKCADISRDIRRATRLSRHISAAATAPRMRQTPYRAISIWIVTDGKLSSTCRFAFIVTLDQPPEGSLAPLSGIKRQGTEVRTLSPTIRTQIALRLVGEIPDQSPETDGVSPRKRATFPFGWRQHIHRWLLHIQSCFAPSGWRFIRQ